MVSEAGCLGAGANRKAIVSCTDCCYVEMQGVDGQIRFFGEEREIQIST